MCQMDAHNMESFPPQLEQPSSPNNAVHRLPSAPKPDKCPAMPLVIESGKKKRVQRAAKLKQCKMDARREQWLAQVSGKVTKADSCSSSRSSQDDRDDKELLLQSSPCELYMSTTDATKGSENSQAKGNGNIWSGSQSGGLDGVKQSPCSVSSGSGPHMAGVRLDEKETGHRAERERQLDTGGFSSMWSSDTSSSSHSHVSSSDDENEVEDWETVADALHAQASIEEQKPVKPETPSMVPNRASETKSSIFSSVDIKHCVLKPERPGNCGSRSRADAGRAWRPDDVSRPQTLPRLSKQHSFPLQSGSSLWGTPQVNVWGLPPPPSHCPICTEELDTTDSSFLPCACGFRLCLFCHHRILIGDGRCPGCRKSYNTDVALKLSRTVSVRPRI